MGSLLPTSTVVHEAEAPRVSEQLRNPQKDEVDAGALFVLKSKGIYYIVSLSLSLSISNPSQLNSLSELCPVSSSPSTLNIPSSEFVSFTCRRQKLSPIYKMVFNLVFYVFNSSICEHEIRTSK